MYFKFGHDIFTGFKMPRLRGLQFHFIKWLKNGYPNFKVLAFWSHWRYHDQIQIIRIQYWNASGSGPLPPSFPPSGTEVHPLEQRYFTLAKLRKDMQHSVRRSSMLIIVWKKCSKMTDFPRRIIDYGPLWYRSDLTWIFNQLPAHKQVIALSATYPKELENMVSFCYWMFFLIFWRNYVSVESSCRSSWKEKFGDNFRYNVWDNFADNFCGISETILWTIFQCFFPYF